MTYYRTEQQVAALRSQAISLIPQCEAALAVIGGFSLEPAHVDASANELTPVIGNPASRVKRSRGDAHGLAQAAVFSMNKKRPIDIRYNRLRAAIEDAFRCRQRKDFQCNEHNAAVQED